MEAEERKGKERRGSQVPFFSGTRDLFPRGAKCKERRVKIDGKR